MDQPTAEDALKELEPLVGEWVLEAIPPGGEPWPGRAGRRSNGTTPAPTWSSARRSRCPRRPTDLIIGCDAANGTYYQLYSDDRGVCRVYEMSIGDGEWKLWREGEPFPQRFTGRFEDDGTRSSAAGRRPRTARTTRTDFDLIYRRAT